MAIQSLSRKPWMIKRLNALYHEDAAKVEQYLARYGLDLSPDKVHACAESGGSKDPIFETAVICPVCKRETPHWQVRTGTQRLETNEFQIPIRCTGTQGHFGVNPILYEVIVCQNCLFASALRSDFGSTGPAATEHGMEVSVPFRDAFQATILQRLSKLDEVLPKDAFSRPRAVDSAIVAYDLACDTDNHKCDFGVDGARFRIASDRLRMVTLCESVGDADRVEELLKIAHKDLEAAYMESEDPKLASPAAYLILAVAIRIGNESSAAQYYQLLRDLGRSTPESTSTRPILRWCKLGQDLWVDWRNEKL